MGYIHGFDLYGQTFEKYTSMGNIHGFDLYGWTFEKYTSMGNIHGGSVLLLMTNIWDRTGKFWSDLPPRLV